MLSFRAVAGLALPAALLAHPAVAAAETRACAVAEVEGDTARLRLDGDWRPLRVAALPAAGAVRIETGAETRARIVCDDGVELAIGVETTIDLDRLLGAAGPAENVLLRLWRGVVGAIAPERNWGRFDIESPLAIASVRSTEWLVEYIPDERASVFVRGGAVTVAPWAGGAGVEVSAGAGIDVKPKTVGAPQRWSAARLAEVGARLGFGWR